MPESKRDTTALFNESRQRHRMMRRLLVLIMTLSLCLPHVMAAEDAGVNHTIEVEGTPIDSIVTPEVSTDGIEFTISLVLSSAAAGNGTTVEWTVQQCINSGVCNPPEKITMNGSGENWTSTITPVETHSYINYDVVLTYSGGEEEKFPEGGFAEGGKVWSDCWVSGEDNGGNNCPDIAVLGPEPMPAPALMATILVGLSAALLAKRDD